MAKQGQYWRSQAEERITIQEQRTQQLHDAFKNLVEHYKKQESAIRILSVALAITFTITLINLFI